MPDTIESDASVWLARMLNPEVTDADRAAFEAWLLADPRHQTAYANVKATYEEAAAVKHHLREGLAQRASMRRRVIVACVGIVGVLGAAAGWWVSGLGIDEYATALGEQREIALEDGSRVTLNTATRIEVRFSERRRSVRLSRGEAHFAVRPDAARPFVVEAGDGKVAAVGTEFAVRLADESVIVLVSDGTIVASHSGRARTRVDAGHRVVLNDQGAVLSAVDAEELSRLLSWRRGLLAFDGAELRDVAAELSRYTGARFVFANPEIGRRRLTIMMPADGVGSLIDALKVNHPDLIVTQHGEEVRIGTRELE